MMGKISPDKISGIMAMKKNIIFLSSCLILSIYIFAVAAYIEILNYRAGNILPRTDEYYNDDPEQGLVKWRYCPTADLKGLGVASKLYSNEDKKTTTDADPNEPIPTPLHSDNNPEWLIQANRENRRHDTVIKFGLPQYPLLFISFVCLSAAMVKTPKKKKSYRNLFYTKYAVINHINWKKLLWKLRVVMYRIQFDDSRLRENDNKGNKI